jgi:hypothetical protein
MPVHLHQGHAALKPRRDIGGKRICARSGCTDSSSSQNPDDQKTGARERARGTLFQAERKVPVL